MEENLEPNNEISDNITKSNIEEIREIKSEKSANMNEKNTNSIII